MAKFEIPRVPLPHPPLFDDPVRIRLVDHIVPDDFILEDPEDDDSGDDDFTLVPLEPDLGP